MDLKNVDVAQIKKASKITGQFAVGLGTRFLMHHFLNHFGFSPDCCDLLNELLTQTMKTSLLYITPKKSE